MLAAEIIEEVRKIAKKDCPHCQGSGHRPYDGFSGSYLCVQCLGEKRVTAILNYVVERLRGGIKGMKRPINRRN